MLKIVDKMGISLWESTWGNCGKVSTFLTKPVRYCGVLWEMFGFTRSYVEFFATISTEFLFGFTEVERVNLHIYT